MEHIAPIITALVAAIGAMGAVGRFIWNKIAGRLDAIDLKLEECERREKESLVRRGNMLTVIELLWAEVKRGNPKADVLDRAKKLMDELKVKLTD